MTCGIDEGGFVRWEQVVVRQVVTDVRTCECSLLISWHRSRLQHDRDYGSYNYAFRRFSRRIVHRLDLGLQCCHSTRRIQTPQPNVHVQL